MAAVPGAKNHHVRWSGDALRGVLDRVSILWGCAALVAILLGGVHDRGFGRQQTARYVREAVPKLGDAVLAGHVAADSEAAAAAAIAVAPPWHDLKV